MPESEIPAGVNLYKTPLSMAELPKLMLLLAFDALVVAVLPFGVTLIKVLPLAMPMDPLVVTVPPDHPTEFPGELSSKVVYKGANGVS